MTESKEVMQAIHEARGMADKALTKIDLMREEYNRRETQRDLRDGEVTKRLERATDQTGLQIEKLYDRIDALAAEFSLSLSQLKTERTKAERAIIVLLLAILGYLLIAGLPWSNLAGGA